MGGWQKNWYPEWDRCNAYQYPYERAPSLDSSGGGSETRMAIVMTGIALGSSGERISSEGVETIDIL
ncbi:hypothetical protein Dimus_034240, partial [Dionaea muscipula]